MKDLFIMIKTWRQIRKHINIYVTPKKGITTLTNTITRTKNGNKEFNL